MENPSSVFADPAGYSLFDPVTGGRPAMKRFAPWSLLLCALALQFSSACGLATHNSRPRATVAAVPDRTGSDQYRSIGSTSSDQRTLRASGKR